jgi:crossover junction endodeoxyribonuclease RuvC
MKVLGIDPGIARTGWGIVEQKDGKLKTIAFDCFQTDAKEETSERLNKIHAHIRKLIKLYSPDIVAVEELFFNTNTKTAFVVGQARGVVLLAAAQEKIKNISYTPLQVKMAVSGYGRAEKAQVGQMVKVILGLKEIPKPDDTADALAVGLTHLFSAKFPSK